MATLRGYEIEYDPEIDDEIRVYWADNDSLYANKLPSPTEAKATVGANKPVSYYDCFLNSKIIVAPNIDVTVGCDIKFMFENSDLLEPPALPPNCTGLFGTFDGADLLHLPVLPPTVQDIRYAFSSTNAKTFVSIPASVDNMRSAFSFSSSHRGSGEMIIRPTSLVAYENAFMHFFGYATLYGDKSVCEALAATSTYANRVTWSPWYEPVPAVTNRGEGSRTTAEDLTRMVHNGALAVSSYAPGRMTYDVGDIVREDEWKALVNAAKTIDPTITYSSHYANLNKIEAAFDSAL